MKKPSCAYLLFFLKALQPILKIMRVSEWSKVTVGDRVSKRRMMSYASGWEFAGLAAEIFQTGEIKGGLN